VSLKLHTFLTSELDGDGRQASPFTPWEGAAGSYWIGGWVVSKASLDAMVRKEITIPVRN